jgi:hypothetical protein
MTSSLSEFPARVGLDMAHDSFAAEAYGVAPPQGHYSDAVAVRRKRGTS